MSRPINITRILGVDINLDLSIVVVVALAWLHWGHNGSVGAFLWGLLLIALLFLSVLAHEMGHALMARECGVQVLDVTLSPIAGVARIEQAPTTPKDDLFIALAGPGVNLGIFMLLFPWMLLIGIVSGPESLFAAGNQFRDLGPTTIISAVATINLGLMLFNLVPAFPLDGGRVLRAFLSTRLSRRSATTIATRIGIGFSVALVVIGILNRDPILPLLGVFVLWAAYFESRTVRIEDNMRRLQVGAYALWDGGGISPDVPLSYAFQGGARDRVVTHRGKVVGMLMEGDARLGYQGGVSNRIVADYMEAPAYIADVSESLWDVQRHMNAVHARVIPVTDKGIYRGIFSADRFLNLYRQVAPGLQPREWGISEEWRDAVLATFRRRRQ